MDKEPGNILDKARKELLGVMLRFQKGMQEYLTEKMQKAGIPSLMGLGGTPMPGVDYYKILNLDKTASDDEVKKRYKAIMAKLHPDKVGEEMTFLSAMVNIAYEMICKERGI